VIQTIAHRARFRRDEQKWLVLAVQVWRDLVRDFTFYLAQPQVNI
jgi:hypothetical protein